MNKENCLVDFESRWRFVKNGLKFLFGLGYLFIWLFLVSKKS